MTTPNSDVIYAMSYVDLGKDGPLVFDALPMLQGILLDFWHGRSPSMAADSRATSAFSGRIRGRAEGSCSCRRATRAKSRRGYFVCRSGTNNVFVFLRAFYADASDLEPPVDLIEKTKIYPLEGEARPMKFPDASAYGQHAPDQQRDGL